jgi:polyphosphate:AMP phosphotransferase
MFESAELGHRISKATYDAEVPKLREALLDAQYDLGAAEKFPVLAMISGVEGAGKGETVQRLNEWMDPRHIRTHGFLLPTGEEAERPPMYRFWRALPPKGRIGVFFGSWYTVPILERAFNRIDDADLDRAVNEIRHLERMLYNEGVLVVKFWFHLSKETERDRLRELEKSPRTRWRVTKRDWALFKRYDKLREVSEHVLRETSTLEAPWIVVDGSDRRYRELTTGRVLLEAMRRRLDDPETARTVTAAPIVPQTDNVALLRSLDLDMKLEKKGYDEQLDKYQGRLNLLVRSKSFRRRSLVLVFEGSDAAGKGGAIRRVAGALDPRSYRIVPVAAPTDEERAQPYLWRFWRHAPGHGEIVVFDRSWYGRVLVERVEGLANEADWMRAYDEINEFEEQWLRNGTILCKFWLQIGKDEQLRRFKGREQTRFKRFKITQEDWRNRKRWVAYEQAVADMVDRTSTEIAPWTLVEANDKNHARVKVLRTICRALKDAI